MNTISLKNTYLLYGDEKLPIQIPNSVDILESGNSPKIADINGAISNGIYGKPFKNY